MSHPNPTQRAPLWVTTTLTHASAASTPPITAGIGRSPPPTRTENGIRYGRLRPGSR